MMRRLATWGPIILLATVLAVWLADAVQSQLLTPAGYMLWRAGLALRSVSAAVYWGILLGLVAVIALAGLARGLHVHGRADSRRGQVQGPVQQAATLLHHRRRGPYFRWLVARRLAEVARAALQVPDDEPATPASLRGLGWAPPANVQAFLEAGLERPPLGRSQRGRFLRPSPTALEGADVEEAIDYMESHVEMRE